MPSDWLTLVNEPQTDSQLEAIRRSVARSQPHGSDAWGAQNGAAIGPRIDAACPRPPAGERIIRPFPF